MVGTNGACGCVFTLAKILNLEGGDELLVECLPCKPQDLSLDPHHHTESQSWWDDDVHHPSTGEKETSWSGIIASLSSWTGELQTQKESLSQKLGHDRGGHSDMQRQKYAQTYIHTKKYVNLGYKVEFQDFSCKKCFRILEHSNIILSIITKTQIIKLKLEKLKYTRLNYF